MQRVGLWLLQNRINAAVVAFTLSLLQYFGLPIGWLASILIALVTLRKGAQDGLYVALWAVLPAMALLFLGNRFTFVDAFFFHILIIYVLAVILRTTQSWSITLESGAAVFSIFMFLLILLVPEVQAFLSLLITTVLQKMQELNKIDLTPEKMTVVAKNGIYISAGFFAGSLLASNVLNLMIARWWQANLFNPGGFAKEFQSISISRVSAVMFGLSIVLLLVGLKYVGVFAPVLMVPFIFSGVGLAHSILTKHKQKYLLLTVFYASLFVLAVSMIFILALLGYVNSWYNLRPKARSA